MACLHAISIMIFAVDAIPSQMLQTRHISAKTVITFSSSFPQKHPVFPQCFRMWKTRYADESPHQVFHTNVFLQVKPRLFLWKTMWKLWKSHVFPIALLHKIPVEFQPFGAVKCGKGTGCANPCIISVSCIFPSFRAIKEMFEMAQNPSGFYSVYRKINGEERK